MSEYKWFYDSSDNPMVAREKDRKWQKFDDMMNDVIEEAFNKFNIAKQTLADEDLDESIFEYHDEITGDNYVFNFNIMNLVKAGSNTIFRRKLDSSKEIEILEYYFDYPKIAAANAKLDDYIEIINSLSLHLELMSNKQLRSKLMENQDLKLLIFMQAIYFKPNTDCNPLTLFHYLLYGREAHGGYFSYIISKNIRLDMIYINKDVLKLSYQNLVELIKINLLYYTLLLVFKNDYQNVPKLLGVKEIIDEVIYTESLTYLFQKEIFVEEVNKLMKNVRVDKIDRNDIERNKDYIDSLFLTTYDVNGEFIILIDLLNQFAKNDDFKSLFSSRIEINSNISYETNSEADDKINQSILRSLAIEEKPRYRELLPISTRSEGWYYYDSINKVWNNFDYEIGVKLDLAIIGNKNSGYCDFNFLNKDMLDKDGNTTILKRIPMNINEQIWQRATYELNKQHYEEISVIYKDFPDDINTKLNEASRLDKQTADFTLDNTRYTLDLDNKLLINKDNQDRTVEVNLDHNTLEIKVVWKYMEDNSGEWSSYSDTDSKITDDAFFNLQPFPEVYIGCILYVVDYINLIQIDKRNPLRMMRLQRILEIK
jgi:hypothetical protein